MNSVNLIGRLTRDPELRYTAGTQMAVAEFNIALDRGKDKEGNSRGADFPRIKVFGKTAEACEKYTKKGKLIGIQGRIQTGSYEDKDGRTIYTTDVVADRVEFLEWASKGKDQEGSQVERDDTGEESQVTMDGFAMIDEDVPF